MNVILFTNSFPPEIRSLSTLMYELTVDLAQHGHRVRVVTGVPRYTMPEGVEEQYRGKLFIREVIDGVDVLRLPVIPTPRRLPLARGLEQFFIAFEYMVGGLLKGPQSVAMVYSPPLPLGLSSYMLRLLYRTPFVFNVQDIYPQAAIDLGLLKSRALIRMSEDMERFIYRRAAHITVHSQGNREVLLEKGVPSEKVSVVHNWVDTELVRPGQRSNGFRRKHELGDKFVVSFAGVMGFAQGLDTVLEAARILRDEKDILFLMVGDGSFKDVLVSRARDMDLSHNMRFLPMQPREEYPNVLAASDACLVTLDAGVKTPVVPAKLLSIMASGRPALGSLPPDGDTPRIIDDAQCGIHAPAGDPEALAKAILDLYHRPDKREVMGRNGRAYAESHFSRRECVAQYESLLERVARGNRK